MFKKLLASALSIVMVLTVMMAVPVSATDVLPDNIGTDYEAGAVTGNLFNVTSPSSAMAQANSYSNKNPADWFVQLEGETSPMVSVETTNYQGHTGIAGSVMYTAKRTVPNPWITYDTSGEYAKVAEGQNQYKYPLNGTTQMPNVITYPEDMPTHGNMVFSVMVNNKSNTADAKIIAARTKTNTGETSPSHFQYPMEYPNTTDGMVVTATGTDTQLFACTFEDTAAQTTQQFVYNLGLPEGTVAGTVLRAVSDVYLGMEYAYDIDVKAEDRELYFGKTISVDADVLNQGKVVGGLSQDVTWYALNADRTETVSGITISEGTNGEATVSVDSIVTAGTYYIVAVSDKYPELVKGVPVTVTAKSYADYVAGDIALRSDNMVTFGDGPVIGNGWDSPMPTYAFNGAGGAGGMEKGKSGNDYYFKNKVDVAATIGGGNPVVGFNVLTTPPEGATGNVVYSIKLRSNGEPKSVINVARLNTGVANTSASFTEYAEENGIVPGTTAKIYTGTFEDKGVLSTKYVYRFGFVGGTEMDAVAYFDPNSVYFGYECPADIAVTAERKNVFAGESFNVDADVLNQIGEIGTISQDVTWYAMNTDRTTFVDGFTFAETGNGVATVSVGTEVVSGTYDIVAVSNADGNLIKGVSINVTNYLDYVANESTRFSNNMITPGPDGVVGDGWGGKRTFGFNGAGGAGGIEKGPNGNDYYFKNKLEDVAGTISPGAPVVGFNINTTAPEGASGNVVYSFDLRADATPKSVINFARINGGIASTSASYIEYANDEGFVPTTSMQTYTGTFADKGVNATKYGYRFGFVGGTELGAITYFNAESAYIGYEYAYDIAVEADKESITVDETVTVDADILNQIGETGGLSQSVTWYAMNTDRTAFIDGFTFVNGENGTASVTVDASVAAGTYDLVAVSNVDGKLIKGVSIDVEEKALIEGITITKTASGVTVATDTDLTDAQLIFVTYNGGKMVTVNNTIKVTLSAQGIQGYSIPEGFDNAKVMLWSAGFKPLANILD